MWGWHWPRRAAGPLVVHLPRPFSRTRRTFAVAFVARDKSRDRLERRPVSQAATQTSVAESRNDAFASTAAVIHAAAACRALRKPEKSLRRERNTAAYSMNGNGERTDTHQEGRRGRRRDGGSGWCGSANLDICLIVMIGWSTFVGSRVGSGVYEDTNHRDTTNFLLDHGGVSV